MKSLTIILLSFGALLQSGCFKMDVHEEIVATVMSPSGKQKAVLVLIDGGATTSRGHVLWLVSSTEKDYRRGERVFDADHCYKASARWIDDRHLIISSDGKVEVLTSVYFDVHIEHSPISE
jgi:hypothetical protein